MSRHIQRNEYSEQDQITLALKKYAARLLAESRRRGRMVGARRKKYVHTVRALESHIAEQQRKLNANEDPYRSIYEFYLQEMGEWYGEDNPGPDKQIW